MNRKKICIVGGIVVLALVAVLTWYLGFSSTKVSDAEKFKNEYEALNGETSKSGNTYQTLNISENNRIEYNTMGEIVDILKSGTGLIYIGFPNCPWCRNAVPVLLDAVDCSCLEKINYLNITDLRDVYELKDDKIEKTKDAPKEYYELLEILDEYLKEYSLEDGTGKSVEVGEKRVYVPIVIGVKNGKIVGVHNGTVELKDYQTPYDALEETQKVELEDAYTQIIDDVTKEQTTCNEYC